MVRSAEDIHLPYIVYIEKEGRSRVPLSPFITLCLQLSAIYLLNLRV